MHAHLERLCAKPGVSGESGEQASALAVCMDAPARLLLVVPMGMSTRPRLESLAAMALWGTPETAALRVVGARS